MLRLFLLPVLEYTYRYTRVFRVSGKVEVDFSGKSLLRARYCTQEFINSTVITFGGFGAFYGSETVETPDRRKCLTLVWRSGLSWEVAKRGFALEWLLLLLAARSCILAAHCSARECVCVTASCLLTSDLEGDTRRGAAGFCFSSLLVARCRWVRLHAAMQKSRQRKSYDRKPGVQAAEQLRGHAQPQRRPRCTCSTPTRA